MVLRWPYQVMPSSPASLHHLRGTDISPFSSSYPHGAPINLADFIMTALTITGVVSELIEM